MFVRPSVLFQYENLKSYNNFLKSLYTLKFILNFECHLSLLNVFLYKTNIIVDLKELHIKLMNKTC